MKILYFSDYYTYEVYGVKRSLKEEVERYGHEVVCVKRDKITSVLKLIEEHKPDQIWLVHSNLVLPPGIKEKIKIPVIGFGFSDPYGFTFERLEDYDIYITNNYDVYKTYDRAIPIHYNPSSCDFNFHRSIEDLDKDIISMIGLAKNPNFLKDPLARKKIVEKLRKDLPITIEGYGWGWGENRYIVGDRFLEVINQSKIGLDIEEERSPLAHRMFEYAACGVPIITRKRAEVFLHFEDEKEILSYTCYEDLLSKLKYYLSHEDELKEIGKRARQVCLERHDIKRRVNALMDFLYMLV